MVKLVLYPRRPISSLRMRTQREWKVLTIIWRAALRSTIWPTRSRISRAALLVNVTARMLLGLMPRSTIWAMRQVTVRVLPVPAPARISTGPCRVCTAFLWAAFRLSMEKDLAIYTSKWISFKFG